MASYDTKSPATSESSAANGGKSIAEKASSPGQDYAEYMQKYISDRNELLSPVSAQLEGTEKQKAYANDIINRAVSDMMKDRNSRYTFSTTEFDMNSDNISFMGQRLNSGQISFDNAIYTMERDRRNTFPVLQATKQAITRACAGSASTIIDKRDGFTRNTSISDAISKIREKMSAVIEKKGTEAAIESAAKFIRSAIEKYH